MEKSYTPEQVAEMLQVNLTTVIRWIRKGHLKCGDGRPRISEEQLMLFLSEYRAGNNPTTLIFPRSQKQPTVVFGGESQTSATESTAS